MTQEEGALLWSTESEFDVEFDRVDCRVEDVDSVVCFSTISLNSYGQPAVCCSEVMAHFDKWYSSHLFPVDTAS